MAIDDDTRLAYVEVLPEETAQAAAGFLARAVAWYAALGITVERVLTDTGSCHRALPFGEQALALGIAQRFTRPYRPQTNGKAERFIRTLINEWAYDRAHARSGWRTRALTHYLSFYNTERRHSALGNSLRFCQQRAESLHLGLFLSVVGIAIGVALTLAAARWMQPLLFQQSAHDPLVYAVVAGVMLAVALAASLIPAWRAAGVAR